MNRYFQNNVIALSTPLVLLVLGLGCSDLTQKAATPDLNLAYDTNVESTDTSSSTLFWHKSFLASGDQFHEIVDFSNGALPTFGSLPLGQVSFKSALLTLKHPKSLTQAEACALNPFVKAPSEDSLGGLTYQRSTLQEAMAVTEETKLSFSYEAYSNITFVPYAIVIDGSLTATQDTTITFSDGLTGAAYRSICDSSSAPLSMSFKQGENMMLTLPTEYGVGLHISSLGNRVVEITTEITTKAPSIIYIDKGGKIIAPQTIEGSETLSKQVDRLRSFYAGTYNKISISTSTTAKNLSVAEGATITDTIATLPTGTIMTCMAATSETDTATTSCPTTLVISGGDFTYTPGYLEAGTKYFTFSMKHPQYPDTFSQKVILTVSDTNRAPTISCPTAKYATYAIDTTHSCTIGDIDTDNTLSLTLSGCNGSVTSTGSVTINSTVACTAVVTVSDGKTSASATTSIGFSDLTLTVTNSGLNINDTITVDITSDHSAVTLQRSTDYSYVLPPGTSYSIRIYVQPHDKNCTASPSSGTLLEDTTVAITCASAKVTQIVAGDSHNCMLIDNHQVRCFGKNDLGQLGYGDTTNVQDLNGKTQVMVLSTAEITGGLTVTSLAAGDSHTCALLSNGKVRCWGLNADGQLGYGDTTNVGVTSDADIYTKGNVPIDQTLSVTQITAGTAHTCALLSDGNARCWGKGLYGRLGDANSAATKGDSGGSSFPSAISAGGNIAFGSAVSQISAANWHTCALLQNGKVRCFGFGGYGGVGLPSTNSSYASLGDDESPTVDIEVLDATESGAGVTITKLMTRNHFSCALLSNGTMRCWGRNSHGQLGHNLDYDNFGVHNDAADANNIASHPKTVAALSTIGTISKIAMGKSHTCAVLSDGNLRCWGRSDNYQLGLNATTHLGKATNNIPTMNLVLPTGVLVADAVGGSEHTCLLSTAGGVYCFGKGSSGQLGNNGTSTVNSVGAATLVNY